MPPVHDDPDGPRGRQGWTEILDPPEQKPGLDPQDEEVGYLILVLWKMAGTSIRTQTFESPPLKRRHLPWVNELFQRIAKDMRDRIPPEKIQAVLERAMKVPQPKPEK